MNKQKAGLPLKTWLVIVAGILLAFGGLYYVLVDRPVRSGIMEADAARTSLEARLTLLEQRAANVAGVSTELSALRASGELSWMPSYNAKEAELEMLHRLLNERTSDYNVSLGNPLRSENQIRRALTLTFTANGYREAKEILYNLAHGEYRCLISNVSLSGLRGAGGVKVSLSAMFYETMVGGTPDMDLEAKDRGEAVDPVNDGIAANAIGNMGAVKDALTRGSDYEGLDAVMDNADG